MKQIDAWKRRPRATTTSWKRKGRRQLSASALTAKEARHALAKYHHYEVASAAFQIAIVLASATVITGIMALSLGLAIGSSWVSTGVGFLWGSALFRALNACCIILILKRRAFDAYIWIARSSTARRLP